MFSFFKIPPTLFFCIFEVAKEMAAAIIYLVIAVFNVLIGAQELDVYLIFAVNTMLVCWVVICTCTYADKPKISRNVLSGIIEAALAAYSAL